MQGGEPVHGVAAYAQHRARLVGAEYRVGRCYEPHLAPASAHGHGRPRAPFVSRLPRVPGRGRLPGRSPPSFPAAPRPDVGVHGRPRNQELPPSLYESISPDQMRSYALLRLAPMYSCISIAVIHSSRPRLPSGAAHFVAFAMVASNLSAPCVCAVPCAFSSARRLNRLIAVGTPDGSGDGSRWVELVGPPRNGHKLRALARG